MKRRHTSESDQPDDEDGPKWADLAAGDINAHMDLAAIWNLRDWLAKVEEGCGSAPII